jgi:hypothetical protein
MIPSGVAKVFMTLLVRSHHQRGQTMSKAFQHTKVGVVHPLISISTNFLIKKQFSIRKSDKGAIV